MLQQLVKYGLVGVVNTTAGLAVIYAAMALLGLSPALSNALGFAAGFLLSYALNKKWTFNSAAPTHRSFALFACVVAVGYALNLSTVMTLIHIFAVNPFIAQLGGVAVYAATVFLGSRYAAFKH